MPDVSDEMIFQYLSYKIFNFNFFSFHFNFFSFFAALGYQRTSKQNLIQLKIVEKVRYFLYFFIIFLLIKNILCDFSHDQDDYYFWFFWLQWSWILWINEELFNQLQTKETRNGPVGYEKAYFSRPGSAYVMKPQGLYRRRNFEANVDVNAATLTEKQNIALSSGDVLNETPNESMKEEKQHPSFSAWRS